jgi:hypothetical protein
MSHAIDVHNTCIFIGLWKSKLVSVISSIHNIKYVCDRLLQLVESVGGNIFALLFQIIMIVATIIFDAPCLFLHHLPCVLLHFVAFLCDFRN